MRAVARRKNQAARREQLLAAARRAIVDQGLAEVRVRDIAEQAGMAPGSITYYYPELEELFREVFHDAVERFANGRRRAVAGLTDSRARLVTVIRSGLPSGADDEICCLLYEFSPQARRNRVDASLRTTLYERQVALYESILLTGAAVSSFDLAQPASEVAHNLVALEDAYGYHVVTGTSVTREQAERLLLGYASTVTRCDLDAYEQQAAAVLARSSRPVAVVQ